MFKLVKEKAEPITICINMALWYAIIISGNEKQIARKL